MKIKQFIYDVFEYDTLVHFTQVGLLLFVTAFVTALAIISFAALMVGLGVK